ncbi:polysaccharide lyase family 8 super-sandwich domain-containing protein [Pedobacter arcticus]|uniref:polysaccharide lyase family 8 super-sandwich domain-containing protein n=1 Tax=Pedobacter arcticus TaxID=752140 RepID=UPI0002D99CE4|nr:polysaccharide lyase family 8 super-sandwich domain-containing protein [Pedobacter arcticus]
MKKIIFIFLFPLLLSSTVKADDYDVLYDRLYADYVAPVPLGMLVIQGYMDSQQTNGSWTDINYDQHTFVGGWQPIKHWERLASMALALKKTSYSFYGNAILKGKIKAGLLYWYNRTPQPYSSNWYDNEIAMQDHINKILILVKNDFSGADWDSVIKTGCDKYLSFPTNYHLRTLTNAVWIARNLIHHGVIEKDQAILQEGINKMATQLAIQPGHTEGVQKDYSFLVHRLQMYNGGYGKSLINTISYYMHLIRGLTLVGFSTENVVLLSDFLLNGDQWMTYGQTYDFSTVGRNISRRSDQGISSSGLKSTLIRMQSVDPERVAQYQLMYNHLNNPTGTITGIMGNNFFYRADYMTHRRENLFIGVKMCSARTVGTEGLNSENLLAYWLPFGATTIMRNTNEYYDIFGVWDWTKIPGVTNPAVPVIWPSTSVYHSQSTSFVGGVSDGINGITAMHLQKDTVIGGVNVDIEAKKTNFLWNGEMICLGAGINSSYSGASTTTTINQSYLKTAVLVDSNIIPKEENTYPNARWVHHDNTGYVFANNTAVQMKTNMQSGNWYTINKNQVNQTVSADIFKLWIDHGNAPSNASYEYIVLPNKSVAETNAYATNMPVTIHANTASLQAVSHVLLRQAGIVFYNPGNITIEPGLTISVDKACVLLVDYSKPKVKVTLSDPAQIQSSIQVSLSYAGSESEVLNFIMPLGDMLGSSVSLVASKPRYAKGLWEKTAIEWEYNLGANTGAGQVGSLGFTELGGSSITSMPSSLGFMPVPSSGKIRIANKNTPTPTGEGEWHLVKYGASPALKFVSSKAGRVAKFSMFDIETATSVASFFYTITFEQNSSMKEMDWQFAIGRTDGVNPNGANQLINQNSGVPANSSTTGFADFFATVRWQIPENSPFNSNPEFRYCYKGSGIGEEIAGTTYERVLNGLKFTQGTAYNMEFYCNNSAEQQNYVRDAVTYTVASNALHIWANGIPLTTVIGGITTNNIPSYNLAVNNKLDACVFIGQRSSIIGSTKHAVGYIQNIIIRHVEEQSIMPVSLQSFNITGNGSSMLLKWSTASEQNNYGFGVLRKAKDSEFEIIGDVPGGGDSKGIKFYSFTDYNPFPGANYYQLKQFDNNGKYFLSKVIAANVTNAKNELKIHVNAAEQLVVSFFANDLSTSSSAICINDMYGRSVLSVNTSLVQGHNTIPLNISNLIRGVYTITLATGKYRYNSKFIY